MSETRVLVLGGSGMLGHAIAQVLSEEFTTFITTRHSLEGYGECLKSFSTTHVANVSVKEFDSVIRAFALAQPTVVINCIGLVKQLPEAEDALEAIEINALFPHRLNQLCQATATRLITFSTDCVFAGDRGNYGESDLPDARDLYGRTKVLGEVIADGALTLRTSIIGRQLRGSYGLVEWFLGQKGNSVRGFKNVVFSGLTTTAVANVLVSLIADHESLSGLYHLASEPINKHDLLLLLKRFSGVDVEIVPDTKPVLDRSLDSSRFKESTKIIVPSWPDMIQNIFNQETSGRQNAELAHI